MSVTSGFFNSLSGDRKYDAIQISSMFDGLITDGIYNGFLESFMVTALSPASMVVTVGEGRCWFNHTWTLNDAPLPLTLDVGDVVLNRIDTIVIDVDSTDTVRACTIKVVKGAPSSQAVRPTLENTETHHQYPLCDISVPAGATTITQSNITNRRGTSDCPFVATLMKSVDVDDLLIQWESQWNDWMTDRADAMDTWTAEQQEAFTTWFQTVQDILDENTAGNLLNRINHRTGINATATYSAGVVAITAPDDAGEILTFVAPSDFLSTDTYTLNGEALTITDLNGEALDEAWKKSSPITITVSGGKAFFRAGGMGKLPSDLAPLCPNFKVERNGGKIKVSADKIQLNPYTNMVSGGVWAWGKTRPTKPTGENTKLWSRAELITTGKPYDGLYLGDVTPSDAVTETLIYLPENDSGSVDLVPEDPALAQGISTMAAAGTPVQLKDIPVSTAGSAVTLKIPETADTYEEYLYGFKNYDGGNAGALVRKDIFAKGNYSSTSSSFVNYGGSTLDTSLVDFANNNLDESVKKYLVEVQVQARGDPYPRSCFALSYDELGAPRDPPVYGTAFPYFSSDEARIAQYVGAASSYWGRDTSGTGTGSTGVAINESGVPTVIYAANGINGFRPTIAVSLDAWFVKNDDGTYTFAGDEPTPTEQPLEIEIDWPESDPLIARQWVYNTKGVYQTMLLGGVASTEDAPAFKLPEFTGNHAIFGDETSGRIELYESGTLTLYPGTYDAFLVGGGASGSITTDTSVQEHTGGGGGGYTTTISDIVVSERSAFITTVGAGGNRSAGSQTIFENGSTTIKYTANGGAMVTGEYIANGGAGGSGGGGFNRDSDNGYAGGSDGSNGLGRTGGMGQGTTTRMFGEAGNTLFSGGGGGAGDGRDYYPGAGGAGGGGAAGNNVNGVAGTANTGGGGGGYSTVNTGAWLQPGAGGSGIIIVRWDKAAQ